MHSSKLLLAYGTFRKDELNKWTQFVKSPFFNTDSYVLRLVELINRGFPDFATKHLSMTNAYEHVYGNKKYDQNKLRKLMSKTLGLITQFWLHTELKADHEIQNCYILKAYKERGLIKQYKKCLLDQIANEVNRTKKDTESYLHLSRLYEKAYEDQNILSLDNPHDYIIKTTDTYVEYQQIQTLIYKLSWLDKVKVIEIEIPASILSIADTININSVTITILEQFKMLLQEPEEEVSSFYYTCFESLQKHHKVLGPNIVHYLVRILLNHLSRLERLNIDISITEGQITEWAIENNHFLYNGILSNAVFSNLCFQYIQDKKFAEARKFIKNNKGFLPPRTKVEYVNFVTAFLHFHQEQYDSALELLNNFYASHDDQLEMNRRQCILYCLLEKSIVSRINISLIESQLAAFSKYLKNNSQLTLEKKAPFKTFLRYVWKILRLYKPVHFKVHRLDSLIEQLNQEKNLGMRSAIWLNKYLEKMRKHHT